jgi:D-inositol-3-phosphate glycosyltransferase
MVHTSPLDQAGIGDAGGMNIYVVESAKQMAALGMKVDIYTRANKPNLPQFVEIHPGVRAVHLDIGKYGKLPKEDLPLHINQLSETFITTVKKEKLNYDLMHGHYWISGKLALKAQSEINLPLVQTMHTTALVKNLNLASADKPEPQIRIEGEREVIKGSSALIANTGAEASSLVSLYEANPGNVHVVNPGVDLNLFQAGNQLGRKKIRQQLGISDNQVVLTFVGRVQPHKGPEVLLHALSNLFEHNPNLKNRVILLIIGGASGSGTSELKKLKALAQYLNLQNSIHFIKPVNRKQLPNWYAASDVVCVPSYSESFGLVALEAQSCGVPVVATAVGGLRTAVADGLSGSLVDGHDPRAWAATLLRLIQEPARRTIFSLGALEHSANFGWNSTAREILGIYDQILSISDSNNSLPA